jgi:hypothetical protein
MWIVRVAVLVSALSFSASVWATSIGIGVTPDQVSFNCDAFENGFNLNGVAQACNNLNASGGEILDVSAGEFTFDGGWYAGGAVTPMASSSVYFVNAFDQVTGILTYAITAPDDLDGAIAGTFQFDNSVSPGLGALPVDATTVVQDGNSYQLPNDLFFAGSVTTEVDPVPEPASLAIFGLGIAGIGWVRRRKG